MTPQTHRLRHATVADGASLHALVEACGTLEQNTAYAYLLLASDFADTSVVAERLGGSGALEGLVLGYRPPRRPDSVFVWQVGVAPTARGLGLAGRLLDAFAGLTAELASPAGAPYPAPPRYLEATVTPSNDASIALFRGFARRHGVPCEAQPWFEAAHFPRGAHEAEQMYRIGPLEKQS